MFRTWDVTAAITEVYLTAAIHRHFCSRVVPSMESPRVWYRWDGNVCLAEVML
jgi:hypothetical protein